MKKIFVIALSIITLQSCHDGRGGTVNDGKKIMINDTASKDTFKTNFPAIDTSKMKDREDIQQRDTFKHGNNQTTK